MADETAEPAGNNEAKEITINQAMQMALEKHKQGDFNGAEAIYSAILEKNPNNPDTLHLLGLIMHQTKKPKEAIKLIKKAIEIKNDIAIYHHNLGMVYDSLNDEKSSAESYEKALQLNQNYENSHLAHYNLGIYYRDNGELDKAINHYEKAIEIKNDFSDAYFNRGLIYLLKGNFQEGWKDYEHRFKKRNPTDKRDFGKPKWDGSDLSNKKILVICEQGFGDSIQFIRYIPLIKQLGGYVILECRKKLVNLFKNINEIDEIIEKNIKVIPKADFDCYIHLLSLPGIFKTNLDNIPFKQRYLDANSVLAEKFGEKIKEIELRKSNEPEMEKKSSNSIIDLNKCGDKPDVYSGMDIAVDMGKQDNINNINTNYTNNNRTNNTNYINNNNLDNINNNLHNLSDFKKDKENSWQKASEKDKLKVGIAWAGNPKQENDKNRSTAFEKFKPLTEIEGIQLYSLQKGDASFQLENKNVIDLSKDIFDFADTAAAISNLDLIISVDTSVSHLAAAMGKPTWTLLTFVPDWRYLLENREMPWYSSMKLFRQKKQGDWDSVFSDVKDELKGLASSKHINI